jgi:hypothetical protein
MKWPATTSDYMAWVTSSLAINLENNMVKLIEGGTLVGDCAYVKKLYMATPLKGFLGGYEDTYNFYLSQLRITVERAFGICSSMDNSTCSTYLSNCKSIPAGPIIGTFA